MSWLTVIWSMCTAACWVLALVHIALAFFGGERRTNVLIAVMAIGAGAVSMSELAMMHAGDPATWRRILHANHFWLALMFIPIPLIVRERFGTGRRWLGWSAIGVWAAVPLLDLTQPDSLTFAAITDVGTHTTYWGETYRLVQGIRNPLALVPDLGVILVLAFVVDASARLWRAGGRRLATLVGGSMVFFFLAAMAHVPLVDLGVLEIPTLIGPFFMPIVGAMSLELVFAVTENIRTEQSLREARTRLEHARRLNAFAELSTGLAHELNQPLAAILSNAQAARRFMQADSPDLDEIRAALEDIVRDDKRAGEVIQRLRSLLNREAVEPERFDLHVLVTDTLALCKDDLKAGKVLVELDLSAEKPVIEAGRVELQQVFLNLVSNAARAMEGRPNRRLRISSHEEDGSLVIEVRDSGPGIPEEIMPVLFEPFTTDRADGLGMGLAIARRLLQVHGSRIEARNSPDGGAVFTLMIPRVHPSPP